MQALRIAAILLLAALDASIALAQSPGPFDGTWQTQVARSADTFCSQLTWQPMTVKDGRLSGTLGHTRGTFTLTG